MHVPITPSIMENMKRLLLQEPPSYHNVLNLGCLLLGLFGFLQVSEFTVPAQNQYDNTTHPSISDVSIDNKGSPHLLQIRIEQSKTDPFPPEGWVSTWAEQVKKSAR